MSVSQTSCCYCPTIVGTIAQRLLQWKCGMIFSWLLMMVMLLFCAYLTSLLRRPRPSDALIGLSVWYLRCRPPVVSLVSDRTFRSCVLVGSRLWLSSLALCPTFGPRSSLVYFIHGRPCRCSLSTRCQACICWWHSTVLSVSCAQLLRLENYRCATLDGSK